MISYRGGILHEKGAGKANRSKFLGRGGRTFLCGLRAHYYYPFLPQNHRRATWSRAAEQSPLLLLVSMMPWLLCVIFALATYLATTVARYLETRKMGTSRAVVQTDRPKTPKQGISLFASLFLSYCWSPAVIGEIRVTRAGCSEESATWPGCQESSSLDRTGPQHYNNCN